MLVLVTGGAGFLGMHLVPQLLELGCDVRVLDRRSPPAGPSKPKARFVQGDVRDGTCVRNAVSGADVVVHAAFASPRQSDQVLRGVNVDGTRNVVAGAVAAAVDRLVVVSSTIVEQPARWPGVLAGSPLGRLNAYRETRAVAEGIATGQDAVEAAIARPKTFLGPGRVGAFAIAFEMVRQGRAVLVPGRGQNRYQLLAAGDLACGIGRLVTRGGGGVYWFGATRFSTVADDLTQLVRHAGNGTHLRFVPQPLVRVGLRAAELCGLTPLSDWYQCGARGADSIVDTRRAREELLWEPAMGNSQALVAAYDWYASSRAAGRATPATQPLPEGHRRLHRLLERVLE